MGQSAPPAPVMLIVAAFSRHEAALDWARQRAIEQYGPLLRESDRFEFQETDYYAASMGTELRKTFFAFAQRIDPGQLAAVKNRTNQWEHDYAGLGHHTEPRPLNLDPGYLSLAKLVLASTKDHAHRIYLADGVFAEITLSYRGHQWQAQPWTYPDYQRSDFQQFFTQCREALRAPG